MKSAKLGLVGDFDPGIPAHQGINRSVALYQATGSPLAARWLGTETIVPGDAAALAEFSGIWCAPGSPYRNTDGALWAIHHARTRRLPFLGTCGGFQHALLEFARNALAQAGASHEELDPQTPFPLLNRLSCSLVEKTEEVIPVGGGTFAAVCDRPQREGYHCNYGLNPAWEHLFKNSPLQIAARSPDGEVRAVELAGHPFFVATLFQPERRALTGEIHPLVQAFFAAVQRE